MKYSHSDSEDELFYGLFDTEAEALADALTEYEDAETVYVGECHKRTIGYYLQPNNIENLLEALNENAGEDCGESAIGWLDGPVCPRYPSPRSSDPIQRNKEAAEYNAKAIEWKKKKAERIAFLLDGFRLVLETWATEEGEQPDFWHIENVKAFHRDEI